MQTPEFIHIILMAGCISAALYLGWLLTETRWRLADKHRWLDRKPFSCRPCLTFHFGWILCAFTGWINGGILFFALGAAVSLLVWAVLEFKNRSKIDE